MSLSKRLQDHPGGFAIRVAGNDQGVTWAGLAARTRRLGAWLQAQLHDPSSAVAVVGAEGPEALIVALAARWSGLLYTLIGSHMLDGDAMTALDAVGAGVVVVDVAHP